MKRETKNSKDLANFFQEAIRASAEEVKSIIETQRIVEEIIDSEEEPQVFQLQVTSNW